jgi:hypothetical protein
LALATKALEQEPWVVSKAVDKHGGLRDVGLAEQRESDPLDPMSTCTPVSAQGGGEVLPRLWCGVQRRALRLGPRGHQHQTLKTKSKPGPHCGEPVSRGEQPRHRAKGQGWTRCEPRAHCSRLCRPRAARCLHCRMFSGTTRGGDSGTRGSCW